jgi:hypothetical protein
VAEVQPTWGAIADRPEDRGGGDRTQPGVDALPAEVFTPAARNGSWQTAFGGAHRNALVASRCGHENRQKSGKTARSLEPDTTSVRTTTRLLPMNLPTQLFNGATRSAGPRRSQDLAREFPPGAAAGVALEPAGELAQFYPAERW